VSLGTDGSPESVDSAIRTDSKTALRREVIGLRAENQWLRQQRISYEFGWTAIQLLFFN